MSENKKTADILYRSDTFKEKILSAFADSELTRRAREETESEVSPLLSERIRKKSILLSKLIDCLPIIYRDPVTLKEHQSHAVPFSLYRLQAAFILATRAFGSFEEIAAALLLPYLKAPSYLVCPLKRRSTEDLSDYERKNETEDARRRRISCNAACDLVDSESFAALRELLPKITYAAHESLDGFCERIDEELFTLARDRLFTELMHHVNTALGGENASCVEKAYETVLALHKDTRRQSGEPYIFHALAVALQLTDYKVSAETLAAALLHDTVEHTDYTLEDVGQKFTENVKAYVAAVTHIATMKSNSPISREEIIAHTLDGTLDRRYAAELEARVRENPDLIAGLYIKAADRLVNLRTLDALSTNEWYEKINQTKNDYLPLFKHFRLGDLSYAIESAILALEKPKLYQRIHGEYSELVRRNAAKYAQLEKNLRTFIAPILDKEGFTPSYRSFYYTPAEILKELEEYDAQSTFVKRAYYDRYILAQDERHNSGIPITKRTVKLKKLYLILHPAKAGASIASFMKELFKRHLASLAGKKSSAAREESYLLEDYHLDKDTEEYRLIFSDCYENRVELFVMTYQSYMYARFGESFSKDSILLDESRLVRVSSHGALFSLKQGATVLDLAFMCEDEHALSLTGAEIDGDPVSLSRKLREGDDVTFTFSRAVTAKLDWLAFAETPKSRAILISYFKSIMEKDILSDEKALDDRVLVSAALALYEGSEAIKKMKD